LSVTTPTSTDYIIFNYWTINGVEVDLSTYIITENTKIVANVTYQHKIEYLVDDEIYNTQMVEKGKYPLLPGNPTKEGYEFDGWTLNGVDVVEPRNMAITENVKFIAKFTKLHTVTFMYEGEIYETQIIRNGEYANDISILDTTYKNFTGWTINDSAVNVPTYKIVADTILVAKIVYSYDVIFINDNAVYDSQIVIENNYFTVPEEPKKSGYIFLGWSMDGNIIEDFSSYVVTQNVTFNAEWKEAIYSQEDFEISISRNSSYTTVILYNEDLQSIIANDLAEVNQFYIDIKFRYMMDNGGVSEEFDTPTVRLNSSLSINQIKIPINLATNYVAEDIRIDFSFSSSNEIIIRFENPEFKFMIMSEDGYMDPSSFVLNLVRFQ